MPDRPTMANAPSPFDAAPPEPLEPGCATCGSRDLAFGPDAVTCAGCGRVYDATCAE